MKKTVSFFLQFVFSCVCTLAVFTLLYLFVCGIIGDRNGEVPIYFSDDGDVLSFFGETVPIDRESLEYVAAYPRRAFVFGKGFLPGSLASASDKAVQLLSQNGKCFLALVKNALIGFFTVGTEGS